MEKEYEQMQMDTRTQVEKKISNLTVDSIAGEMVQMAKAALLAAAEVGRATRDLLNQAEDENGKK